MGMSDTSINQFNLSIRQSPWYQAWFVSKGLNPNKVKLSDQQRAELKSVVEANTDFQFPKDMKIDPAGNLNEKGGWAGLPTGVKIALIAAAAVGTAGAAGAFGGAAGAASGAAGGGSAATTGGLATTAYGTGMAATAPSIAGAAGGLGGTAATIAGVAGTGLSTMDRIGQIARAGSNMIGAATESAATRQELGNRTELAANAQNITGENAFQDQQQSMARLEADQQELARKNLYRASVAKNPTASPENRSGAPKFSPEMLEGMTNLEKQALLRTAQEPIKLRRPREYRPLDPAAMSQPSTMQTIGNWLAPSLSIANLGEFF